QRRLHGKAVVAIAIIGASRKGDSPAHRRRGACRLPEKGPDLARQCFVPFDPRQVRGRTGEVAPPGSVRSEIITAERVDYLSSLLVGQGEVFRPQRVHVVDLSWSNRREDFGGAIVGPR